MYTNSMPHKNTILFKYNFPSLQNGNIINIFNTLENNNQFNFRLISLF